jgi:DNA-binding FadR family transcriptional regulator
MLKPIKKESVRTQVFWQLRDQIVKRAWPPGSKLPSEKELAQSLGVSRLSVREGIQHLVSLGILKTRQGEGTFVCEGGSRNLFHALLPLLMLEDMDLMPVLEYRRIFEKGTAALAALRATPSDLAELRDAYRRMVENRDERSTFAQADLAFHLALAQASKNPVILKVNSILQSILEVSMGKIVDNLGVEDGLHFHRLLLEAMEAKDADLAESIMQEHVDRTMQRLQKESEPVPNGTSVPPLTPVRASLPERLALHRTFWARKPQPRPLASFRVGDFFFARHFQAALPLLVANPPITPDQLKVYEFLPDYERMFQEAERLGQDGFWAAEPYTGIPWMEAITGCPVEGSRDSFITRAWLSSPEEALERVHFDPQNPWLAKYLEFTAALVRASRGRYPVGMPIMRGPSDMLGALLGQKEMVFALMDTDPVLLEKLIERLAQGFLKVIEAQRRLSMPFYGGETLGFYHIWAPGRALWFQDDLSALLSPSLYRRFFLPAACLILKGNDYTAFHLHPNSFFLLDLLLSLEDLKVIQVNKDTGGPSVREMLPVLQKIIKAKGLILWGDITLEDLAMIRENLPCRGLALHIVAPDEDEARARRQFLQNWQ